MSNPAPTLNQINAFNATQGTTIDFNIIGGTELVRSNRIYIYDLSDNSLICTHLYVSTESIHELPKNTDSSIVYASGKSSANFVNGAQYYAQIQTYTDTAGTWIISATASFPATNATGYRDMYCTTSSFSNGTTTAPANWGLITRCVIPAGNYIEFARATFPVTLSSGTLTFRVVAHHSANTNINVTGRIYATRIK